MTLRIAVNGCGRIGRNIIRAHMESPRKDIDIVMVNDLADVATTSHLLCFDTIHGRSKQTITHDGQDLYLDGKKVLYRSQPDPRKLDYAENDIDLVLECTGRFVSGPDAQAHIDAGAKRVLISAPGKQVDRTIVYGVNHETLQGSDKIISNASCTTNCLAPLIDVIDKSCGIEQGFMTTIHAYTSDQQLLDSEHRDLYRARAAAGNIIPTTTGAARAISLVLPHLEGRLDGVAVRVPTPNVSAVDLVFQPERPITVEALNEQMVTASSGRLSGVLDFTDRPLVSTDFNHHPASSIIHLDQTKVMPAGLVRIFSWYDNEWGFSNRMLDSAAYLAAL